MASSASRLESKLFSSYWDDGLLDLFFGMGVAAVGATWAFDLIALGAVAPVIFIPIWQKLRRTIVEPRAGFVEFSDTRVAWTHQWLWIGMGLGALLFVLGLSTFFLVRSTPGDFLPKVVPGLPCILLGLLAALGGLTLRLKRSLIYAGILTTGGVGVAVLKLEPHVGMTISGLLITLCGAVLFVRFLQIAIDPGE